MTSSPFQWIVDALHPFEHDVASLVPPVFDSYARIFHPAYSNGSPVTWRQIAKDNGRVPHPAMEWGSLLGTWNTANYAGGLKIQNPSKGKLPADIATELAQILEKFTDTRTVYYALWTGYGGITVSNAELMRLPERPMSVVKGSIENAANPFALEPARSANLWWPEDNKWCVASEIDLLTTYVGGSNDCIKALTANTTLEAMQVDSSQSTTWDADTINPLPDSPLTHHKHM